MPKVVKVARYRKDREPKTKQPKVVRVGDLPTNPPDNVFLLCDKCGAQCSCDRRNYDLCDPNEPMVCMDPDHLRHPMRLVRQTILYEDIR
jgi:hypothetical protein